MRRGTAPQNYNESIFINCPFDDKYDELFDSLLFTIQDCGYRPRCALEESDSSQVRIERIYRLIDECKLAIHDLSRTEPDAETKLPRFNMPLELGIFLGARHFGGAKHRTKRCLVLDRERYRFQKFCSDISGQDIEAHSNEWRVLVKKVRDWLQHHQVDTSIRIPSGQIICSRRDQFLADLPLACSRLALQARGLTYRDKLTLVKEWLGQNPWDANSGS